VYPGIATLCIRIIDFVTEFHATNQKLVHQGDVMIGMANLTADKSFQRRYNPAFKNTENIMDLPKIEEAVRQILKAVGENPDREGLKRTPNRVARMYAELFSGLDEDPAVHLTTDFTEEYDEMVVLKNIPFNSMCEHHLMPFEGKAGVAYLPDGKVVGISKLARVVDGYARRPQVQERMTSQIADLLTESLAAKGVAVVLSATHACMTCRGIKKAGSVMITSAVRGLCRSDARTRSEVMSLLHD
jgi:GTP cyclohydrolase I